MSQGTEESRWNGWIALLAVMTLMIVPRMQVSAEEPTRSTAPEADEAATHDALRVLKREVEAAFNRAGKSGSMDDFKGVLEYVNDRAVLAAMNGDLSVGKDKIIDYFQSKMTGPSRTVRSVEQTFETGGLSILYGDDAAVAYGTSIGKYDLVGGLSFEVNTIWTCTLVKEGEKWLIASFQFGPSIFDNPFVKGAARSLYWGIGISGGGGIVLGFLFGRLRGRRTSAA